MLDAPTTPTEAPAAAAEPAALQPEVTPALPVAAVAAARQPVRMPHMGHLALLGALLGSGLLCTIILIVLAISLHLFGISKIEDAMHSMAYAVGTMAAWYIIAFVPAVFIFPAVWGKKFLAGVQWNAPAARRRWPLLMATGAACFLLAMAAKALLHFPDKSPIAGLMSTPQAVWIMFAFSITVAPLCEEMMFRGFLLPALSTGFDWTAEKLTHRPPRPLLAGDHPAWSLPAVIGASIVTSIGFAFLHAGQIGSALGPLVLIFCVSLVLCTVRLITRSLAASTLTHATYNFTLFLMMAVATHGFHNLHG